jgi:hypothetical protein
VLLRHAVGARGGSRTRVGDVYALVMALHDGHCQAGICSSRSDMYSAIRQDAQTSVTIFSGVVGTAKNVSGGVLVMTGPLSIPG